MTALGWNSRSVFPYWKACHWWVKNLYTRDPARKICFGSLIPNLLEASEDMSNQSLSAQPVVDPLLKVSEAAKMLSISVPSFWRRVADGSVPKPIKLGCSSRWPQSEILAVIENAKARR